MLVPGPGRYTMQAEERIHPSVIEHMRLAIKEAEGREVLFVGRLDAEGRVKAVITAARGDDTSVPALSPHMEKGDVVLHNHPGGNLRPSKADLLIAAELGNQGIGFIIVNSRVDAVYVVAEPVLVDEKKPLDVETLAGLLEPGGALNRLMESYEPRRSQVEFLRMTADIFNTGGILAAEAGTGVGKSMAYLVPALAWAAANNERVVVSTATINLQEQLIDKDIPLVKKLLRRKVQTVLVKGRGNYLCLSRLKDALEENSLFAGEDSGLEALSRWAEETPTGSRSDLPFFPEEGLWSRVCSEADSCTGLRCPNRERCFLLKARREAAAAKVLVVNHHLLFSDLALRIKGAGFDNTAVLPPFHRIVFDEAHNIESSATSFFSESFSRFVIYRYLSRLLRHRGRWSGGLLPKLGSLPGGKVLLEKVPGQTALIREQAGILEAATLPIIGDGGTFRITEDTISAAEGTFLPPLWDLQRKILDLVETVTDFFTSLPDEDLERSEVFETRMLLRRFESLAGVCEQFRDPGERPERVFWIEKRRTGTGDIFLQYTSTPLDITRVMREAVYEPFDTVVFTSATLTVNRSFQYWKTRIGLTGYEGAELREELFESPFDFKERVLIGVPSDAPAPESEDYRPFLARFIADALLISEGRALVLFTSYDMLIKTYESVRPAMDKAGISLFRQGDDERSRLLRRFNEDTTSVLFATDSFWEGVDSPGDTLLLVILCRLPFRVPTDPVLVARMEAIRLKGGNPFFDLSLPEAVMKLKQGFGRLMRRTSDRGAVLIPDGRIVTKNYGSIFLSSLPETRRSIKSAAALFEDLENFLAR
jgi:ATP-dependent DNA helicase DinG